MNETNNCDFDLTMTIALPSHDAALQGCCISKWCFRTRRLVSTLIMKYYWQSAMCHSCTRFWHRPSLFITAVVSRAEMQFSSFCVVMTSVLSASE